MEFDQGPTQHADVVFDCSDQADLDWLIRVLASDQGILLKSPERGYVQLQRLRPLGVEADERHIPSIAAAPRRVRSRWSHDNLASTWRHEGGPLIAATPPRGRSGAIMSSLVECGSSRDGWLESSHACEVHADTVICLEVAAISVTDSGVLEVGHGELTDVW